VAGGSPFQEKNMKTTLLNSKRAALMAGVAATLTVSALGFAGAAQARDNVTFSVGLSSPGVQLGVTNGYPVAYPAYSAYPAYPVYSQPQAVYVQPQPVYVQPRPVYVQPAPIYVPRPVYYGGQPVYVAPQPVYYGRPRGHWNHGNHGNHYGQQRPVYGQGYAPVYYQR
jgi:hypothetical protein